MSKIHVNQRREGAEMIIRQAQSLAAASGIELSKIAFDNGKVLVGVEKHILVLSAGEKVVRIELSAEALEDFPGRVGTESTITKVRCGINELL
jgi:hypothetical protein